MSRGTGWSPALLGPEVCQYVVGRPEGKPDLHCTRPADHVDLPLFHPYKPHMVTPEFDYPDELLEVWAEERARVDAEEAS